MAKMADCTELNDLREDVSSVETHDSSRAKFLSNYIGAYLACHSGQQDLLVKAVAEGRGGDVNSVAKAITADMGIGGNEALEIDILEKLAQISESKGPISGDAQKDDTSHFGADPVMLFKGQFVHEVDDIHISGAGIDFVFKRTYKNQVIFNGPLGYNWTHNFHIWLRVAVADQVIFRTTGDLREEPFTRHPLFDENNLVNGEFDYWIPPDGKHGVIFTENNSFVLRQTDGSRQIFEPDPGHSFLHRLRRIEDRFGNYLHLHYDEDQRFAQIEINQPNRIVTFEYDAQERICLIHDYTGREWGYKYDSIGDLIAVTSPSTERYDCGLTVNYNYSSAFHSGNLQHNLVRIIDAAGQIYLETEYGTSRALLNFNRVVRQRQGGGEYLFEYEDIDQVFDIDDYPDEQRPAHQTFLLERNGQRVKHIYNKFGNLLQREQCVIERGLPRTLFEQYRYDRDGNVVSSLSPEGVFTQHLFGRDYFVRHHGLTENGDVPTNNLTWKERQAFGRILATVRRGGYASFDSFTLTRGIWGNFPDILDGQFPFTVSERSQDIIIKMTYEDEFGQLLTISDPRFTNSADPDELEEPNEHLRHKDTLTRYTYSGPTQLLVKIQYPTIPLLPDGTLGTEIAEKFTKPDPLDPLMEIPAYDANGRLQRSINPVGVVTELTYFDDPNEVSFGHLRRIVADLGGLNITVQNEVDELGRVIAVHLPKSINSGDDRFVAHTVYNDLDQVIETTTTAPFSFQSRRFYDRTGKLEREESDLRNKNGQPELGGSTVATFCYDEEFNLVETTVGGFDLDEHLVTKHCYDNAGNRTLSILPNGNQVRTRYDERQLPVNQTSGAGSKDASTMRTEFDGDGRIRRSYDARSNPTTFEFDTFGRVISVENALGHITRTNYDKASNVTCVRVFEKRDNGYFLLSRKETDYDELNRVTHSAVNRFEDPFGPFQEDVLSNALLASPGPGELLVSKTVYDENSRIVKIIDPLNRESTSQLDNLDRVILVTDPLGNQTKYQYDDHNNLIRTDQCDLVLNENGDVIGERHFASSSTYDELDRLVGSNDSLGNASQLFYDSRGNVVRQVDPLLNESHATFDIFNRPISSTRFLTESGLGPVTPESVPVTTAQEYDLNGNLTAVIDALGRRTRYQYDALDRRRAIIYPDESQMLTDYDVDSNLVRTEDNNGLERYHTVDALSRTTRVDVDKSGLPIGLVAGATFERYMYDGLNRQTVAENDFAVCSNSFNSLSWPLAEMIEFTIDEAPLKTPFVIFREFDDVGALVKLTYPNGRELELERDELDRLVRIQNLSNGNDYRGSPNSPAVRPIAQMRYAGQQRDQCLFGNGANTAYQYDGAGRVIEIAHSDSNAPLLAIQYLYDAASNVRIRNDVLPTGPSTERFAYDSHYRLAHEFKPNTTETFDFSNFGISSVELANPLPDRQSAITTLIGSLELPQIPTTYNYDLVGSRDIETTSDGNSIDYEPNQLDQYIFRGNTNYSYDDNGNLKNDEQRFSTFDSRNRLVQVSTDDAGIDKIIGFWHDALGRRILEQTDGKITQLICDGNDIIAEYRDGGLFAQYVFNDGVDRPLHIAAEEKEHWFHADLVGSVRLLSDANGDSLGGYRYTPFGELIELPANDIFNPWRYTGRRFDVEQDTYDYRARQYDPKLGHFAQRDPTEMIDGTNLYLYTQNNPLSGRDPRGYSRDERSLDDDRFTSQRAFKLEDLQVYTIEDRTEMRNRISDLDKKILDQIEIKSTTRDQVEDLEHTLFLEERWVWPNWDTLGTVSTLSGTYAGCLTGPWTCVTSVGIGIYSLFEPKEGAVVGVISDCPQGAGSCVASIVSGGISVLADEKSQSTEKKKISAGDELRVRIRQRESMGVEADANIDVMRQQRKFLKEELDYSMSIEKLIFERTIRGDERFLDPSGIWHQPPAELKNHNFTTRSRGTLI